VVDDYVIAFLDDDLNRVLLLHERMNPVDIEHTIWVRTVDETIDLLVNYRERLRYVSLDHDLGGATYVHSGREDCGMEVVRFLEHQAAEKYAHVVFIVHSWNTPAAMKMTARLRDKGYRALYVPYGM
jgi:hypothetical protein